MLSWRSSVTLTGLIMSGIASLFTFADDAHIRMPSPLALLICAFTLVSNIGGPDDGIQRSVPFCAPLAKPHMAILKVHDILTNNDCPLVV